MGELNLVKESVDSSPNSEHAKEDLRFKYFAPESFPQLPEGYSAPLEIKFVKIKEGVDAKNHVFRV